MRFFKTEIRAFSNEMPAKASSFTQRLTPRLTPRLIPRLTPQSAPYGAPLEPRRAVVVTLPGTRTWRGIFLKRAAKRVSGREGGQKTGACGCSASGVLERRKHLGALTNCQLYQPPLSLHFGSFLANEGHPKPDYYGPLWILLSNEGALSHPSG